MRYGGWVGWSGGFVGKWITARCVGTMMVSDTRIKMPIMGSDMVSFYILLCPLRNSSSAYIRDLPIVEI